MVKEELFRKVSKIECTSDYPEWSYEEGEMERRISPLEQDMGEAQWRTHKRFSCALSYKTIDIEGKPMEAIKNIEEIKSIRISIPRLVDDIDDSSLYAEPHLVDSFMFSPDPDSSLLQCQLTEGSGEKQLHCQSEGEEW